MDDIPWQDELYNEMNWPDFMDYSMFDLVMHPLASSAHVLKTKISKQKEKVLFHLNRKETVRLMEKISFVFGVTCVWTGAFVMGRFPDFISHWYTALAIVLFTIRWFSYKAIHWHYFCFDLCYFANFLVLVWLWLFPQSSTLYIAWAILAWRNSMVFHSLDKVITVFIHLAPPVLMFSLRWFCDTNNDETSWFTHFTHGTNPLGGSETMNFLQSIFYGLLYYTLWQVLYFIGIVQLKGKKVDAGLRITSYSWMMDHAKNGGKPSLMFRLCNIPGYDLGEYRLFLFMFWQWLYALVSIVPVALLYRFFWLHAFYTVFLLSASIWNGACYYLEVFSKKQE